MKKLLTSSIMLISILIAGVFFGCEAGLTSNSGDSETDPGDFSFSDMYKRFDRMQKQIDTLSETVKSQDELISGLTLTADRAYALTYPHILTGSLTDDPTDDHLVKITSGSGRITYAGGDFAVMQGKKVELPAFEFTTAASKTYHVRFKPHAGWSLNDLSNGTYNPGGAAESDTRFDSSYEDMLAARVVTNGGNSVTCTPLHNNNRLQFTVDSMLACENGLPPRDGKLHLYPGNKDGDYRNIYGEAEYGQRYLLLTPGAYFHSRETVTLNWARQPKAVSFSHDMGFFTNMPGNRQFGEHIAKNNRYQVIVESYWVLNNAADCVDLTVIVSGTN
ncbi:MAG: hypothetical protein GY754_29605 [bacterium]|nr:hypothetical protein [bacterium]